MHVPATAAPGHVSGVAHSRRTVTPLYGNAVAESQAWGSITIEATIWAAGAIPAYEPLVQRPAIARTRPASASNGAMWLRHPGQRGTPAQCAASGDPVTRQ